MSGNLRKLAARGRAALKAWREGDDTSFQNLFETAGVGVAEVDVRSGRFVEVNACMCEMLRCPREELLQLGPSAFHPQADRDALQSQWMAALRESGRWEREVCHIGLDGAEVWSHVVVTVRTRDADGAPLRAVAVVQDATQSRRLAETLRQNQELLRLGQQAGRIGTFSRDIRTGAMLFGPEMLDIFGFPRDAAPRNFGDFLNAIPTDDRIAFQAALGELFRRREPEIVFEHRIQRQNDGETRYLELRARYFYDEAGEPLRSVGVVIDLTERKEAERRIEYAAHHDLLTGLPNRALFQDRLHQACKLVERGGAAAVVCLDLDRFKDINDTRGHAFGDALLRQVAERLQTQVRGGDTLARLGGDEFAVLMFGLREPEEAGQLARRLHESFAEPFNVAGARVSVGVCLGIALAPRDGESAEDLMKAADLALNGAKSQPQRGWRYFESGMNAQALARHALESDLHAALAGGEFELHYQPLIDIAARRVKSFEALVRWRHPVRGLVPPMTFIPVCERNGLILPLGAFVLRRACEEAARWPAPIGVAVNVSAVQMGDPALVDTVAQALAQSGLEPERLELEITETALLEDTQATLDLLRRLKGLGVRIALDDFGAGHSSLGYLQSFPFDKVKIDRAFAAHVEQSRRGAAIVKAMLQLCAALDLTTTVEGVETQAQLDALAALGAQTAQGYLFSPPRPAGEVAGLIERLGGAGPWTQAAE